MLFITFDGNYADEFDVDGFMVIADEAWKRYVDSLTDEDFGKRNDFYFGSNESLSFEDKANYLSCFDVKKVSDDELVVLKKFFGGKTSVMLLSDGFIPLLEDKFYPLDDEEEDSE